VLEEFYRLEYSAMKANQHFEGTYHLHLHGLRVHQARKHHEVCTKLCLLFNNDDRGAMFSKMSDDSHQTLMIEVLTFAKVHGVISHKIEFVTYFYLFTP
jgi:hypothetical protein